MRQSDRAKLFRFVDAWYTRHARLLPWRETHDPYRILVSEIMLQQTQVSRVTEKYKAFLRDFPTVKALANATPAAVIREWKGLGYNRRALYLHRTAQTVVAHHKGRFPKSYSELIALPGIGDYTARAILSFAFLQPVALMDTNHRQFYQRLFGQLSDKELLGKADQLLSRRQGSSVYRWNQAIMDIVTRLSANEADPTLAWFTRRYPAAPKRTVQKKVAPFHTTNRFARGRILDLVRHNDSVTTDRVYREIPFEKDRLTDILQRLEKDGLIQMKKRRIMLP